jgi:hypothetical protein
VTERGAQLIGQLELQLKELEATAVEDALATEFAWTRKLPFSVYSMCDSR